jgi:hypothetical protein
VELVEPRGGYEVERVDDVVMRTRDGVRLAADVYRPVGLETAPTLVRRTPYGKHLNDLAEPFNEAHYYASHGYLTVVQNTRGRFGSEGAWYPFAYEARDGFDAVEWAARLPGSNGRVGMFGQSYGAVCQYLAAAQRPPHLVTAVPVSAPVPGYLNYWFNHGALELSWTLSYFMNMARDVLLAAGDYDRLAALEAMQADPGARFSPLTVEALRHLPIRDWVERFGAGAPFLADVAHHETDGPYWWYTDYSRRLHDVDIPMLHIGSWYDIANFDTPATFTSVRDQGMSESTREGQALFMGPWAHLLPYNQPTSGGAGDIDFGPEAAHPLLRRQREWFDHVLRDGRPGLPMPRVSLFVTGRNTWRDESEWPPARVSYTPLYLDSDGWANTAGGDGRLGARPPTSGRPDTFVYDPLDPVPTQGGRYVGGGVADQRAKQERSDVLVYTGEPLAHEFEVIGPVNCRLHVGTDAPDTDFVVMLCDRRPDGFVQNLAEGIVRCRYRESYDRPAPMRPDVVYELVVELGNIAHLFAPGHRVVVQVTSSDFPRWDRNLNSGERVMDAVSPRPARQVVHHDSAHPSALVLPVVSGQPGSVSP